MLKLFKRLRKAIKLKRNFTLSERLQVQQSKVNLALGAFADAYEEVEKAQGELNVVKADAAYEIEKLQRVLDTARDEYDMNEKVKVKLAEFIPGKE